jgi:hypothetical protein
MEDCCTELEHILTNSYKADMIAYMQAHPEAYEEAIALAVTDKQPFSWRAAWLLWSCMDENDTRLRRHIRRIIAAISTKNDGQQRELIKILHRMTLSARDEGAAFDLCLTVWERIDVQPSVRVNALKLLVKIARRHPDLSREIRLLAQDRYIDSFSRPVRKSVARLLKDFNTGV